jgi:hypothetical protein
MSTHYRPFIRKNSRDKFEGMSLYFPFFPLLPIHIPLAPSALPSCLPLHSIEGSVHIIPPRDQKLT